MNNSVSYLTLFKAFMKIGIVTFGGGYAIDSYYRIRSR